MADRIDVIALKPISLGGVNYQPEDRISMGAARVKQYELQARMGHAPAIRRADGPAAAAAPPPAVRPAPIVRPAAVVNAEPQVHRGRYRNRRLRSEN